MKIAIDVDGVLRNLIDTLNVYWDKKNEDVLRFETVDGCKIQRYYQRYVDNGELLDVEKFLFGSSWTREIWLTALPYSDNCDDLDKIPMEHEVVILTSQRNQDMNLWTVDWLNRNRIRYDEYICRDDKWNEKFDLLVDDKPTTVEQCWIQGKAAFLMDRPWNQQYRLPRINRINELEQIWRPYGA